MLVIKVFSKNLNTDCLSNMLYAALFEVTVIPLLSTEITSIEYNLYEVIKNICIQINYSVNTISF